MLESEEANLKRKSSEGENKMNRSSKTMIDEKLSGATEAGMDTAGTNPMSGFGPNGEILLVILTLGLLAFCKQSENANVRFHAGSVANSQSEGSIVLCSRFDLCSGAKKWCGILARRIMLI
jgi:hypothetical protein